MDVLVEYRRRAAECERLALDAITDEHRQTILQIAATWRALANHRERLDLGRDEPAAPQPWPPPKDW